MEKKKRYLLLKYILGWMIFSICYFFLVEPLLNFVASGWHNIQVWLIFEVAGLVLIFLISFILFAMKWRKLS